MAFKSSRGHNHGKELEVYGSSDIGKGVGVEEIVQEGGGSIDDSDVFFPPFSGVASLKTRFSSNGELVFSTDNVTFQSTITVEIGDQYFIEWGNNILTNAPHGSRYTGTIQLEYLDLGVTEDVNIVVDPVDKIPDPFTFTDVTDTIAGSTQTSNNIAMLGSINAPTYLWGTSDSTNGQMNIGDTGWVSIPSSPGATVITSKDNIQVRHVCLNGALTDTTTTINIGYGSGAGQYQSESFVTTNINSYVEKPSITSPTASEVVDSLAPTLTSSAFASVGSLTHGSTDWQIASDSSFNSIVWESLNNSSNLTSITSSTLSVATLYVRVRHRDTLGAESLWSDGVEFSTPFGSTDSNSSLTSSTNMEINASTTITLQPGTYRVTLWGAGGGGGANGAAGGAGGSVRKDVTYTSQTNVAFTIGTAGQGGQGACHENSCTVASGGSPGGGNGGTGDWRGGGGGGYSSALGMTAGGGGGGSAGGGYATGGGQNPSTGSNPSGYGAGGCRGPGSRSSSGGSGSNGGGGGGGAHQTENSANSCQSGNGGNNSGTYDTAFAANGTTPGNSYASTAFSRTFGSSGGNGGARIERIGTQYQPVLSITSDLSTTNTATAGGSQNFSISATDTANNDSTITYQWYLSTNGGSSYSPISGATSSTLTRYSPFYYNDNGHKIYCRASVSNSIGSAFTDSNVCTLTVNRNYDCNSSTVSGTVTLSNSGNKPSAPNSSDQVQDWGTWSPGFSDICEIDGYTNGFNAGGRCDFCRIDGVHQGWNLKLELRITRSTDGTKRHWGDQTNDNTACDDAGKRLYNLDANGGGWDPENDGVPTYRLVVVGDGTECKNGAGQDIAPNQYDNCILNYSYKRRSYYFETRPT